MTSPALVSKTDGAQPGGSNSIGIMRPASMSRKTLPFEGGRVLAPLSVSGSMNLKSVLRPFSVAREANIPLMLLGTYPRLVVNAKECFLGGWH